MTKLLEDIGRKTYIDRNRRFGRTFSEHTSDLFDLMDDPALKALSARDRERLFGVDGRDKAAVLTGMGKTALLEARDAMLQCFCDPAELGDRSAAFAQYARAVGWFAMIPVDSHLE